MSRHCELVKVGSYSDSEDSDNSISYKTDSLPKKYIYVQKEEKQKKLKKTKKNKKELKSKKDISGKSEELVVSETSQESEKNKEESISKSPESKEVVSELKDNNPSKTSLIAPDTERKQEEPRDTEKSEGINDTFVDWPEEESFENKNKFSLNFEGLSREATEVTDFSTAKSSGERETITTNRQNTNSSNRTSVHFESENLTDDIKTNEESTENFFKTKTETAEKTTNTERKRLKYPPMAEFSVVIKKREEESDYSDYYDENSRVLFYNDKPQQTEYKEPKTKTKKKTTKKKSTSARKSPKKEVAVIDPDLPKCPVCQQPLDNRIKRVYSKPIATEVYFPFLDQDDIDSIGGRIPKVKICYPCYEHLMIQWKEYNKAGLPHSKRKYRDLNGKRIKTKREKELEEQKQEEIEALNKQLEESESEEENNEEQFDHQNDEEETPKVLSTRKKTPSKRNSQEDGLLRQDDMQDLLAQIHTHIEMVEFNSNANLERTKLEIEHAIRKHSNRTKDDIQGLKVENEIVRKQVVRMRRELAEMRTEVQRDVKQVKKRVLKQEKKSKKGKDDENVVNISKTQQQQQQKPFMP